MSRSELVDEQIIKEALSRHSSWNLVGGKFTRTLKTLDYSSCVEILSAQVELAERLDHHPNVEVSYRKITFQIWTHDCEGITQLDIDYIEGLDKLLENFTEVLR